MKSFQTQNLYEVLEVSVGASVAEVRAAYERLNVLYAEDQVVLYGLIDPARATALRTRLQEALTVLSDDGRREAYDAKIGLPPRVVETRRPPAQLPPARDAAPGYGSYAWVSPAPPPPPSQPVAYTYAVPAPVVVERRPSAPPVAPTPVAGAHTPEAAPVAAAVELSAAPQSTVSGAQAPTAAEPSQLALDVPVGVSSWGIRPVDAPPVASPPGVAVSAAVAAPAPVVEQPPAVAALSIEPPMPMLADDVEVAIVPARATPSRDFKLEVRPRAYEIPEGVEINGDLLRQVRLAKGLSLVQVAERTRIGAKHLENVEGDRYDALPAAVYLRGILMNLARELGLDGLRVSRSYLTFVEAHRSKG